jgi:hypothetical protein
MSMKIATMATYMTKPAGGPTQFAWRLTVKLSGRTIPPDRRHGRSLAGGARGVRPHRLHGPLQRQLEIGTMVPSVSV